LEIDFSLLLPTRGRPQQVARLLDSLARTARAPQRVEVVLYLDDDDIPSHDIDHPVLRVVKRVGLPAQAMGVMLGTCYAASSGRYVMLLNDDAVCRTSGWDEAVRSAFARFPDGIALVYGNDLDQGQHVPTFPILSRRVCEILGEVCPRDYLNLHVESHLLDIFRRLAKLGHDRIVYLDSVVFEHLHHSIGKSMADATSVKRDQGRDTQLYFELADVRQDMAHRLARHITSGARSGRTAKTTFAVPAKRDSGDGRMSLVLILPGRVRPGLSEWVERVLESTREATLIETIVVAPRDAWLPSSRLGSPGVVVQRTGPYELWPPVSVLNQVSATCRGQYVAYLPQGAKPAPDWLPAAVEALRRDPARVIVGARLLHPRNGRVVHAGIAFIELDGQMQMTMLYRGLPADHPAVNRVRELQAVGLAGAVLARVPLLAAHAPDPSIPDVGLAWLDFCIRVRRRGGRVVYAPTAVVEYDDAEELSEMLRLFGSRAWRVESDLPRLLHEDGFALVPADGGGFEVRPVAA
jgi:GT2 family glycosyltransferase